MEIIKDTCYKGTRILVGNEKRELINNMIKILIDDEFSEISIPIIQYEEIFTGKVGEENNNMMFNFKDRGNRKLCLSPEYTAIIQKLSKSVYKFKKDVKLFYVQECFRGEKPQDGRYRQFTQLGVEIINPSKNYIDDLIYTSSKLITNNFTKDINYSILNGVTRGLDYYDEGKGFEIICPNLGSSKQICGGGKYDGGVGFAIGIDRLLTL
jgi:histidyl-tRNA synthetase